MRAAAEPTTAGLAEQARLAQAGEASAVELMTAALERARPREPFAEAATREPRRLRVALSFATPFGV